MTKETSKKIVLGFLKICKYTLFNIWKMGQAKKLCQDFLRSVSIVSISIWERGQAKKLCSVFLSFLNLLFLIFEIGDKQKNCARNF